MKAHVILAHPETKSFNGRLAELSRATLEAAGYKVTLSDLCAMGFDPCEGPQHYGDRADRERFHAQTEQRYNAEHHSTPADVVEEQERLLGCDVLVVHFPLWWFGPPAILKGWMDRVFVYGAVYRGAMRYDAGICRGKKMLACITTGASAESCSYNGREGDTRLMAWPIVFPFRYIGFDVLQPVIFHGVGGVASIEVGDDGMSETDRYVEQWGEILRDLEQRPVVRFNRDEDFGETKQLLEGAPEYSPFVSHEPHPPW